METRHRCLTDPPARGEAVCVDRLGRVLGRLPPPGAVLPGSFNPLHAGHLRLAAVAAELLGRDVAFELSLANVDKPTLTVADVAGRLSAFENGARVWLTWAATFREKAALFPGATFVVGADTALRLVTPCYHQDDPGRLAEALAFIRDHGCRFLVAGRLDAAGRFVRLADLPVPAGARDLFEEIPDERFRLDLSSTQLRRRT
jgi:hypothetical protein